ncbi:MAG: endolytic transglycosylase MltG [Acidobacteriota bacterium]
MSEKKKKRGCFGRLIRVGCLLFVAALGAAGYLGWQLLEQPHGDFTDPVAITIERGSGATAIFERLANAGVIVHPLAARAYHQAIGSPPLLAGEYRFDTPMPLPAVIDKVARGEIETHPVTLIEGLDLAESAASLASQGFGDEAVFLDEMRDPTRIRDLDPEAESLEGYLYPDTYRFGAEASEAEIVDMLVAAFRQRWENDVAPGFEPGRITGLDTVRDVVSLASIVEKEARLAEERPVIAAVYTNRLEIGMGLYADPTVIFALKRRGTWDGNIRKKDLQVDDPYNTYRYRGLPPGPIASPAIASLLAVTAPADVPYLYFVSRNDGSHVFAESIQEHNRNVNVWQKQYWRKKWAEEGRN